ncbi:hypothetical protein MBLNU13_g05207t1 [Cladosporium sp. NU13]
MTKLPPTPEEYVECEGEAAIYRKTLYNTVDRLGARLREANDQIHSHPELCYEERHACATLVGLLREQGLHVVEHAFGLETSFQAEFGTGGRVVTFCAEYDALPGIGHACGHNLIATASVAAFLGSIEALRESRRPGRVRLLGCPAEEGGGGKIKLLKAGAFKDVDAAIMAHPTNATDKDRIGVAYGSCLAATSFRVRFDGKPSHAGATPWLGINALDAASLAYTAIGLLRQQCRPDERINVVIDRGSQTGCGVITEQASMEFGIRCPTMGAVEALEQRVRKCIEGAALATSCTFEMEAYADIRPNETLCVEFTKAMQELNTRLLCDLDRKDVKGYATDMGNVSYECPSIHPTFIIPTDPGHTIHSEGFALSAATSEAHEATLAVSKGLGYAGLRMLLDEDIANAVKGDFKRDQENRN